jgi:hypothetical protein
MPYNHELCNHKLPLNQAEDVPTRIGRAKAFLQENPTKKAITTTHIYKI